VAPPVGDMAVGSILIANSGFVNVSGPPITMTMQNAPARTVLMSLSRMGGYGFVYVNADSSSNQSGSADQSVATPPTKDSDRKVSISFKQENYARAVNSVLIAAGLQGKVEGNTLLAGPEVLSKSFGAQLSKVMRLNQVSANSAADYLANLGAQVKKTNEVRTSISSGQSQSNAVAGGVSNSTTVSSTTTKVEAYGAKSGPLIGVLVTTDPRLATITLVGSPALVAVAETYLRQLDLRQRQVALSVKILDVSLDNQKEIDNSFAFRYGNNFIVNDQGQMVGAFGGLLPPDSNAFSDSNTRQTFFSNSSNSGNFSSSNSTTFTINDNGSLSASDQSNLISYLKQQNLNVISTFPDTASGTLLSVDRGLSADQASSLSIVLSRIVGRTVTANANQFSNNSFSNSSSFAGSNNRNPGLLYPQNNFYNLLKATIESTSTKVLASPTLILSENSEELRTGDDQLAVNIQSLSGGSSGSSGGTGGGGGGSATATIGRTKANESFVTVGEQVITNYTVTTGTQGNGNSCQPQFGIAGLTFGARVSKIDDNGFVTFSMSPAISATVRQFPVQGCGPIDILAIRRLDTGSARVRDGQTLILTGVISDRDTEAVTKWPILGDIPIIGQFFRNSGSNRAKRELVILVTPRIIDDTQGGSWGYGYQPSTRDARRFMGTSAGQSPY
jgi:type IV pilus assembly protein PilQ